MIDPIVQHQALIRELINGSAMILCLTLTIMISVFMWDTFVDFASKNLIKVRDGKRIEVRSWAHAPGVPTACALWWVFAAETYRAGSVWLLYQIGKHAHERGIFFWGYDAFWSSYGYMLAGLAFIGGLLRAIFIFTPPEWKSKVWLYASAAAAVFVSSPSIISYFARIYNGF